MDSSPRSVGSLCLHQSKEGLAVLAPGVLAAEQAASSFLGNLGAKREGRINKGHEWVLLALIMYRLIAPHNPQLAVQLV